MKKIVMLIAIILSVSVIYAGTSAPSNAKFQKEKSSIFNLKKINKNTNDNVKENKTFFGKIADKTKSIIRKPFVDQIVLVILSFFIPPLAVFLKEQLSTYFWIDLILTFCFWVPGIIFALLVVLDVI